MLSLVACSKPVKEYNHRLNGGHYSTLKLYSDYTFVEYHGVEKYGSVDYWDKGVWKGDIKKDSVITLYIGERDNKKYMTDVIKTYFVEDGKLTELK